MAPAALTANSFLLSTTPHPRLLSFKNNSRFTVFAKASNGPFRFGKSTDENQDSTDNNNGSPFRFDFDFGTLPDVKSLIPVSSDSSSVGRQRRKDPGTVFVAGASGQAGIRIAQTLLRQGFNVRAGVSDLAAAQDLARLAATYKVISNDESKRLNAVASTFDDAEAIAKAIGNASKVVVTISRGEDGPTNAVTTSDAVQVIEAAQLAGVGHVAIVYDESSLTGSTYNVLDGITFFFNNLFSKSQPLSIAEFLQKIVETDVNYTLIKTNLTEDFSPESSYKLVVTAEGTTDAAADAYKVPKTQIAKLVGDVFSNTAVAENKVVQVFTSPSAPLKTVDELFSGIPEDGRRKAYAEALEKSKAEAEVQKQQEEEIKKLEKQQAKATKETEDTTSSAAATSVESLLDKAKDFSNGFSFEKLSSQLKSAVDKASVEEAETEVATIRGRTKARNLPAQKAVVKTSPRKPITTKKNEPKKETEVKTEKRKVFGGLFQQETIYVDD